MVRSGVLVVGAAIILGVSWRSLRDRHSHGFYRLYPVESIPLLILFDFALARRSVSSHLDVGAVDGLTVPGVAQAPSAAPDCQLGHYVWSSTPADEGAA